MVESERRASHVYYRLADRRTAELLSMARSMLQDDGGRLAQAHSLPQIPGGPAPVDSPEPTISSARPCLCPVGHRPRRGITVLIKGVKDSHVDLFRHVGVLGVLGALRDNWHLFDDLPSAIEHARSHVERASSRL